MNYHPAVHHNKNKRCHVSFQHNGQYISLRNQYFKTRQDAVKHVKMWHRGATGISVVFYVPHVESTEQK